MNDDVDMRHYGALRKVMPITFVDLRPAATSRSSASRRSPGFCSKDKIIEAAFGDNVLRRARARWSAPASPRST